MPNSEVAEDFLQVFRRLWRNSIGWRKWMRASSWGSRPKRLSLCETLSLGEKRFVAVVRFENQQFLLGGTGHSIALLAQLPPDTSCGDLAGPRFKEPSQPQ